MNQSGDDGGPLGDHSYPIGDGARTRRQYLSAQDEVTTLREGSARQMRLCKELGAVPRHTVLSSPMYELTRAGRSTA